MRIFLSFLLMLQMGFSYAQNIPELFKKFNPVYPADNKLVSFTEKAGLMNKISFLEFAQYAAEKNKQFLEELKKVDSLLTISPDNKFPVNWEGRVLKAYSDTNAVGEVVVLQYPEELSLGSFSMALNLPEDSVLKIKTLKRIGRLIESKSKEAIVRNEIDYFPKPVNTEEYASHLLQLIRTTLTSYESKLKFPYPSYLNYENSKNLSPLSKKINFRISFLKRCYANI